MNDDQDNGSSSTWTIAMVVAGGLILAAVIGFVFFKLRPV